MQTRAIVEFGDLDLNRAMRVYGPVGDLALYRGRYYPSKAPLMSFAAVPIYFGLRLILGETPGAVSELRLVYYSRLLLTALPTLLLLLWLRRYLVTYVSVRTADAILLTYALGTLAFSYSLLFMSHQPSAVLLFAAFYGLWRWSRAEWPSVGLLCSGAFASASVFAEYTTAIAVLGLALFGLLTLSRHQASLLTSLRASGLFLLGALPLTLLLGWYHTRAFGGPLDSGYRHLADVAYQPWHEGGLMGVGLPQPKAFFLSLFSPLRGLFMLSPALLLAVPGLALLFRRAGADATLRPLAWTTLTITLGYSYFTAAFSYESWGWTTGPRHLTALMPFLLLPCALTVEAARRPWLRAVNATLCAVSILATAGATLTNYIPDDVSNALVALSLPLLRSGFFMPTALWALGVPNPLAGCVWIGLILALASSVFWLLAPTPLTLRSVIATTAVFCGAVSINVWTYQDSEHDRAALLLLKRVWLDPPSRRLL